MKILTVVVNGAGLSVQLKDEDCASVISKLDEVIDNYLRGENIGVPIYFANTDALGRVIKIVSSRIDGYSISDFV